MAKRAATESHPISLAELARRSGKNRSSITRQAQGPLRAAMLADGRIDAAHDAVAAWARGHGIDPRALTAGSAPAAAGARRRTDEAAAPPATRKARSARAPTRRAEEDENDDGDPTVEDLGELPQLEASTITSIQDLTLGDIARRFKTETRFLDILKGVKTAEEIRYKFLDNEEQEGRLIPRDFVVSRVLAPFDELFRKFLSDLPKTVVRQCYALGKAGEAPEKGEAFVRDSVTVQIRALKERLIHDLGALQPGV